MVDVVVNNVMGLKTDLSDLSSYTFKDKVRLIRAGFDDVGCINKL